MFLVFRQYERFSIKRIVFKKKSAICICSISHARFNKHFSADTRYRRKSSKRYDKIVDNSVEVSYRLIWKKFITVDPIILKYI